MRLNDYLFSQNKFLEMKIASNVTNPKDAKLFFSNISLNAEEIDIFDLFSQYGKINNIDILRDKSGRSRGAGYIEFEDPSSNQNAIEALDGKLYKDSLLHLEIVQTNYLPNFYDKQNQGPHPSLVNGLDQTKIRSPNKPSYFTKTNLDDLPVLPPPPPIYPIDRISASSRSLSLSAPPYMSSSDFPNIPPSNNPVNVYQKKNTNDSNYSDSEYDYYSDYTNSDYYYTNSESDDENPKQNQSIPQIPQVSQPIAPYQMNPHLSNLQPLKQPPPLPPLPPILAPLGATGSIVSNSSVMINPYPQPTRNSGLPLPPSALMNDRNGLPQSGMNPGHNIPNESDFNYGIRASASSQGSIIQSHERRHHHRTLHSRLSRRLDENMESIHHERDEQWVVMPPPRESLYWRKKRAFVIDELKKAAYEELRNSSNEKGKASNFDK